MNQSKSEYVQTSAMYLSIFYSQNLWHNILPVIREILVKETLTNEIRPYVFFSSHKGSSIRIGLEIKEGGKNKIEDTLVRNLTDFMLDNPSAPFPVKLPISGFFQDFPSNVIKYNLFNQRSIIEGGLSNFQLVLSKLLLAFFDGHEVDEDALFTLMVSLHESILKGLSRDHSSGIELIERLIFLLEIENEANSLPKLDEDCFDSIQPLMGSSSQYTLDMLLLWVEKAANLLLKNCREEEEAYLIIHHIIKLHLFNISSELFVDALHYLENSTVYVK